MAVDIEGKNQIPDEEKRCKHQEKDASHWYHPCYAGLGSNTLSWRDAFNSPLRERSSVSVFLIKGENSFAKFREDEFSLFKKKNWQRRGVLAVVNWRRHVTRGCRTSPGVTWVGPVSIALPWSRPKWYRRKWRQPLMFIARCDVPRPPFRHPLAVKPFLSMLISVVFVIAIS